MHRPTPALPVAVIALAILLAGCAHTQTRPFDPHTSADRETLNARALRGDASVVLVSGERILTRTLRLDVSEATWVDASTGKAHKAPLADIQSVRVRNGRRYMFRDAVFGAAVGLAIGSTVPETNAIPGALPTTLLRSFVTGLATITGTVMGAGIGYEKGRTRYILAPTDSASARPSSGGG